MSAAHQRRGELAHASLHMFDGLRRNAGFFSQRKYRINESMVGLTAGVGLEPIIRELPARTQIFGCVVDVVAGCHYADKAARSFEDAVGAGETALRKQRGDGPVLSGSAGMEGLAHRAEYLA